MIAYKAKHTDQEKRVPGQGLIKARGWRWWVPRLLAGAVGLILLTAGLLKATNMELFIRQIRDYGIIYHYVLVAISAWSLIVLECTLGVGLLVFYRPRLVLPSTAVLLLIFAGVTGWAWLTGATTDCGCFGTWLKRTPQEAALEALTLLIATLLAWVGLRHLQPSQARAKTWTVSIACLIGLTLPLVFGFPLSRINQAEWKVGQMELGDLEIHGLDHIDLKQGEYIINLMDTDCLHCQESVEEFNALAQETDLPVLIGLCINEAPKLRRFVEEFQPIFPIGQIREDVFWRLMAEGDLPRTILVRDGRIQQVWDKTVPDKDMIKVALSD